MRLNTTVFMQAPPAARAPNLLGSVPQMLWVQLFTAFKARPPGAGLVKCDVGSIPQFRRRACGSFSVSNACSEVGVAQEPNHHWSRFSGCRQVGRICRLRQIRHRTSSWSCHCVSSTDISVTNGWQSMPSVRHGGALLTQSLE